MKSIFLNNNNNEDWLNDSFSMNSINITMSNNDLAKFLSYRSLSNEGDDMKESHTNLDNPVSTSSVIPNEGDDMKDSNNDFNYQEIIESTIVEEDIFTPVDFFEPILFTPTPLEKTSDVSDFEGGDFSILLSEMQQHLAFLTVSQTDTVGLAQLLESGFSPRPDQFALLHG